MPFLEKQESDGSGYLFTASLPANPKSLDPQSATDAASKTIIENLYEGLVELDENGSPQLAAAESYTTSADGLVYTFLLKNDRYWFYDANQDDVVDDDETWKVTASDYAYAFQRIFDPQTQSPYTTMFSCLQNADAVQSGQLDPSEIGVRAVSDTELQFTLSRPDAEFLSNLASTAAMPCNENFFQRPGALWTGQGISGILRRILPAALVLRPVRQPEPDLHAAAMQSMQKPERLSHQSDLPDPQKQRRGSCGFHGRHIRSDDQLCLPAAVYGKRQLFCYSDPFRHPWADLQPG